MDLNGTPTGVPEEAETQGQPMDDSIGFIPALLPERRGTANRVPGIALRSIPWLFSDAPSALRYPNRELLVNRKEAKERLLSEKVEQARENHFSRFSLFWIYRENMANGK